ncbi:hypothetical protein GCM10022222_72390 [Amycolatopsis ultiminotia]|uniref:ABC-type transport system involved in multi-copper enzyme maturation, permease component n=1 Tax=Amycolatopsis ultiminotia TaxID=543629 RepID=A0ABP6Y9Z6_9PSEU
MVSMLRVELRRTIAPWVVLVMLVVGIGFFVAFTGPWIRGSQAWGLEALSSAQWTRFLLVFLWPIIVGASAIQGMRDNRAGVRELFTSTARPAGHRAVQLGLAMGIAAVVGYLVVLAVGMAQVIANDGMFTFASVAPVVLGLLSVVAGVGLGLGVGRLLPHPITAPAIAVISLVATFFLQIASNGAASVNQQVPNWVLLLSVAPDDPRSPFDAPSAAVVLGQICWLAGLAGTGFLLLTAGSVRTRLLALLPVVAGLAVAIPVFPASAEGNLTVDKAASALVCDGPVCVTKMHEDWLPTLAGPGKQALQALQKLPQHPDRVEESTAAELSSQPGPRDPARLFAQRDDLRYAAHTGAPLTDKAGNDLVADLLEGAGAPRCARLTYAGPEESHEDAARRVMESWLLGSATPPPSRKYDQRDLAGLMQSTWTALHAQPEQEQIARVAAARQVELTCHGDALAALTGGAH